MAKINRVMDQKLSGQNPRLTVDLDEMFGSIVPDSTAFRQRVGQAIIDEIRERSENGQFLNPASKANQAYSETYAKSDEFKAYGKSKGDVNMTQTGDMLGLMDIVEEGKNKIVIGWTDSFQAAKAHGHITGNVGVKRDFFGLPMDQISQIAERFQDDLPLGDKENTSSVESGSDFTQTGTLMSLAEFLKQIKG